MRGDCDFYMEKNGRYCLGSFVMHILSGGEAGGISAGTGREYEKSGSGSGKPGPWGKCIPPGKGGNTPGIPAGDSRMLQDRDQTAKTVKAGLKDFTADRGSGGRRSGYTVTAAGGQCDLKSCPLV